MQLRTTVLLFAWAMTMAAQAQSRLEIQLNKGWQFSHDKQNWQQVDIPHDWAIAGPFDKKWDLQMVRIEQNGEKKATEKSGRSGALPWIGEGYYRKTFKLPKGYEHATLMIDGAMAEPTVYVNGQKAGYWAYGYNAFNTDITPYIQKDGGDNLLEIDLKNVEESSRWYPGAGLYRPIKLVLTQNAHFGEWETYARTLSIDNNKATVNVDTRVVGNYNCKDMAADVALYDAKGMIVARSHSDIQCDGRIHAVLDFEKPELWSPESPYLYKLVNRLYSNRQLIDEETTNVGVRTIHVSKDGGFMLNGVSRKIKGVCLHHDLGPLGAAVNKSALIRQIKMMKAMGCDAIRTSHNMPSTMQMQLCDSLGMMVMAESFDMWIYPKCKNGYARFFKEWSDKDITNLVLNHRNHPCIVMWSIGNEIPEQWSAEGVEIAKHLQDICHQLDPSRPVTQGMDRVDAALKSGFAAAMDIPGLNYRIQKYDKAYKELPQGFILGSETASTVSSRDTYKFPVVAGNSDQLMTKDGQCSGYDVEQCSWSNLPDDDWCYQDDKPWVIGEFVWTGYDYLGEPTPYDEYWPSRSSYFGICDLAGLPKDRYYLYRSHWLKDKHTVHLLPHWTWPDRKGKVTPVYCYTDGEEGELFINGKSQGRVRKNKAERLDRYRLRWNDVKYEPGEMYVVAYDTAGNEIGRDTVKTAGKPKQLLAQPERNDYKADGEDLIYVQVSLADANGTTIPQATDNLTFEVTGEGHFEATCNGDATSLQSFKQPEMKLFAGKLVVILRPTTTAGTITLNIKDKQHKITKNILIHTK